MHGSTSEGVCKDACEGVGEGVNTGNGDEDGEDDFEKQARLDRERAQQREREQQGGGAPATNTGDIAEVKSTQPTPSAVMNAGGPTPGDPPKSAA